MKRIIAVIPARYASTRFPAKMLARINNTSVIAQTYLSTKATDLFDKIIVATDHDEIAQEIEQIGGTVFKSQRQHVCGTDRIAEVLEHENADVIVNVQGDEPFIEKSVLEKVIACFDNPTVVGASFMQQFKNPNDITNSNFVKVVVTQENFALYFSRSPIPYIRNTEVPSIAYHHIGIYGFTRKTLFQFAQTSPTPLESVEQIEAIRFLEMGLKMKMALTTYNGIQIDTKEDFERAKKFAERR